ncbi:helix-turn-helix transcriptional regulator [Actinosynnema sp. CS-041913]|uniref:helix-turn-helix transcriptional regulator n=1 Tax=Actinosynnema sp. CS-041913 TaxID=3239917 RepID=UPI003D8B94B4
MRTYNGEVPRFDPDAMIHHRRRARITQVELGRRLCVHDNQIYRWEKGITPIAADDLRRVARELRVVPAQLQRPLDSPPTLTDLRSLLAITPTELARRLAVKPQRLAHWERGHLGPEHGPLLAALLGIGEASVRDYEHTGQLPVPLAHRLARALRTTPEMVSAAFLASGRAAPPHAQAA